MIPLSLSRLLPALLLTLLLAPGALAAPTYTPDLGPDVVGNFNFTIEICGGSAAQLELFLKDQPAHPAALLLPAIQKVRSALEQTAGASQSGDGKQMGACEAAQALGGLILVTKESKRGESPALIDLLATGWGKDLKQTRKLCAAAAEAPPAAAAQALEDLVTGLFLGLLRRSRDAQAPKAVIEPLEEGLARAQGIAG